MNPQELKFVERLQLDPKPWRVFDIAGNIYYRCPECIDSLSHSIDIPLGPIITGEIIFAKCKHRISYGNIGKPLAPILEKFYSNHSSFMDTIKRINVYCRNFKIAMSK